MINLYYSSSGTLPIAVYPEVTASSYPINTVSSSFSLEVVQEYDRSSGSLDLTLINIPNKVTPRLVFSYNRNEVPQYSGQYNATVKETKLARRKWGTTHTQWSSATWKWSDVLSPSEVNVIDIDRAWVSGSDFASFDVYTSSSSETIYESGSSYPAVEYASPDETGAYTTYH